ncbi:MAG: UDP-N-acetylmuramoyl-L-alanyl-D-glutamate--2,6-diaminopimelate ligase [Bacteroidales bacterium]|nr:UDP-N-acetylmuramoyl-L-alanyl-D-glutamate--2,6-diaminopimelate ligase [Bacteroidales bacterium]MCF8391567.1 UDP-N-acetylmuramoyl-L-alanyl-D-glutamate--2,6-diaminopimelate ligase [Bacteroidales bacterium]
MKSIKDILSDCTIIQSLGKGEELNGKICFDSRLVAKGDMFIAVKGSMVDGHNYIENAILSGAEFIVCEEFPEKTYPGVSYFLLKDTKSGLGKISSAYYGHPSRDLKLVGVTGTNGKTTIASLLFGMTRSMGYSAGLISTIKVCFNEQERPATHTTPDPIQLHASLKEMLEAGCEYVFMEVSSHAIHQERTAGLVFKGGIFTNLTHDHLDYHQNFANYRDAKKKFFDGLNKDAFALINKDDKNGAVMVQNTKASVYTYSLKSDSDFRVGLKEMHIEGNLLEIDGEEVWTRLPGEFNAYNLIAVYGASVLLGHTKNEVQKALSLQKSAAGRFEIFSSAKGAVAIVDYAHTPDALENVLKTIRKIISAEKRIITIVGSGGDRDKTKRPTMAKIAAEMSDKLILTSDNPRSENPEYIIRDMEMGLSEELKAKTISIVDRNEAIKVSCSFADANDVILLAGKGHENYQEIKGVKLPFDDREKIKEYLKI